MRLKPTFLARMIHASLARSRFEYTRVPTTPYTDLEPGVNFDDWAQPEEGAADEE